MKHSIHVEGLAFRIRPLTLDDAQFVINLRLNDLERNQYINPISDDLDLQKNWIENYFLTENDYYFVIENTLSAKSEGLIGIYDADGDTAEWGRWVLENGSLASIESIDLICKAAFNHLGLSELYCRTILENERTVAFHDKLPQKRRCIIPNHVTLRDATYDVVEHYITAEDYYDELQPSLERKAAMVFKRNIRSIGLDLEFHHIGVATNNIEQEFSTYRMLGYEREGKAFEDHVQGIKGLFIVNNGQPRLELLENLPESNTLDKWISEKIKVYHFAYKVRDIERAIEFLANKRVRLLSPLKQSAYFGNRICFLVLPNRFMIELIED
jgi:RimJ/RimL family protein N-acetyltransferase/catechol 2,3-dioxygenase-like lactoylglutathione lyase family enzyme